MLKEIGLSNITTSEGNLKKISKICEIIKFNQVRKDLVIKNIKKSIQRLTNEEVIKRYLFLSEKLGFIKFLNNDNVKLTDEGEALVLYLTKNNVSSEKLSYFEKILFLQQILIHMRIHILKLLEVIKKYDKKEDIILNYFLDADIKKSYNILTIDKNIRKLQKSIEEISSEKDKKKKERNIIPRTLGNFFQPMKVWLISLDVLEKSKSELRLTEKGLGILNSKEQDIYFLLKRYTDAGKIENYFSNEKISNKLLASIRMYRRETEIVNFIPIKIIFFIELLEKNLFIEPKKIYDVLRHLVDSKDIRSLIVGREGLPSRIIFY